MNDDLSENDNKEVIRSLAEENNRLKDEILRLQGEINKDAYKTLFDASPDIIIQVDRAYKIIICHIPEISLERLDALKGRDIFDVTPAHLHDLMRNALNKVINLGETVLYESEGDALGAYRYYINYLSPIKDEEGNIYSAYFISREITQLKLSEKIIKKSERTLKALFGSSQHIHILMEKNQKLVWFNKKADEVSKILFGRELEVGVMMRDFLYGEFATTFNEYFERSLEGEVVVYQRNYPVEINNHNVYLEMMLQPLYEDDIMIGISLVGVETSERRANEEKLEKVNKELILQNQQLNQYSYIISHNLRGPIVTLMGLANIFEEHKNDIKLRDEIISHIKRSTIHLDNIIKDLNTVLSQSDGQEMQKVEVDFIDEIEVVKDLLKTQIDNANAEIYCDLEVRKIFSIKSYIHSMLLNLMSNSLKYKKLNKNVVINIRTEKTDEKEICVYFSDNGLGIDLEKNKDKLFGFYKRFHTHVEGKGLGLYLLKIQINTLGGRIEVESEINKGTTFKIYLKSCID